MIEPGVTVPATSTLGVFEPVSSKLTLSRSMNLSGFAVPSELAVPLTSQMFAGGRHPHEVGGVAGNQEIDLVWRGGADATVVVESQSS